MTPLKCSQYYHSSIFPVRLPHCPPSRLSLYTAHFFNVWLIFHVTNISNCKWKVTTYSEHKLDIGCHGNVTSHPVLWQAAVWDCSPILQRKEIKMSMKSQADACTRVFSVINFARLQWTETLLGCSWVKTCALKNSFSHNNLLFFLI